MFWVQGSPTDFTSAFIWISCVSLFYNRTNHTFILVTFDMAVPGNIPSLVINTFVALNIVLDKQWRIQLSFMCKHHHTVLSRSTAHFFLKFKLEIHTKRSEDSSGGKKNKTTSILTAKLLFSYSHLLFFCRCWIHRAEVGHDHEELLKANLVKGANIILMLVPVSQSKQTNV